MKKDHAKKRYIGKIIVAFLFGAAIMAFIRYITMYIERLFAPVSGMDRRSFFMPKIHG